MKIDEFTEKLQSYSIDDFVNAAEKPYEMLIEAAEWKIGLFKQYSAIMLKHVEDQTKDNKIISYVKGKIGIGEMMIYNRDFTNIISEYINTVAIDKDTSDKAPERIAGSAHKKRPCKAGAAIPAEAGRTQAIPSAAPQTKAMRR